MKELIIIGAGSVGGHIALNITNYLDKIKILGFLDDDSKKKDTKFVGLPILGPISDINKFQTDILIVVGIAFPSIKKRIINSLEKLHYNNFPKLISKDAWVSRSVTIGKGSVIYPGCSINYNSTIGDFVVMNMNCAIGHDCTIGSYTSLSPTVSLGGNTDVGEEVEMGIGCSTIQGIEIGGQSRIGGQSMVLKDVPKGATVVGNPGRVIKK